METHIFSKLPKRGRKVGSADIVEYRKMLGYWDVKFPLKNITVTMDRLIKKIDANGEPFRLAKEEKYTGHHKVEYWLEPRTKARKKRNGK
jgi:hypothetical protein